MLDQVKNYALTRLIKKLNDHGINVDPETVEKAINNSPEVMSKIEAMLISSEGKERVEKIKDLLNQIANNK